MFVRACQHTIIHVPVKPKNLTVTDNKMARPNMII